MKMMTTKVQIRTDISTESHRSLSNHRVHAQQVLHGFGSATGGLLHAPHSPTRAVWDSADAVGPLSFISACSLLLIWLWNHISKNFHRSQPSWGYAVSLMASTGRKPWENPLSPYMDDVEAGGSEPERDKEGFPVLRAWSYTPLFVPVGMQGERLRIPIGPVNELKYRTFLFTHLLGPSSTIFAVRLRRPFGIIMEEDPVRKRAFVSELVSGANADRLARVSALTQGRLAPQPGDVLRACTTTTILYPNYSALFFGAVRPLRTIVVFGADRQAWSATMAALSQGLVADGEVTLVFERASAPEADSSG
eukprot:EG_transcript_16380